MRRTRICRTGIGHVRTDRSNTAYTPRMGMPGILARRSVAVV